MGRILKILAVFVLVAPFVALPLYPRPQTAFPTVGGWILFVFLALNTWLMVLNLGVGLWKVVVSDVAFRREAHEFIGGAKALLTLAREEHDRGKRSAAGEVRHEAMKIVAEVAAALPPVQVVRPKEGESP